MDTSARTVQRALNRLRALNLSEGIRRRVYDLDPLVDVADRLAVDRIEFLAARSERGRHTEIAA
jgi:hypothetical protein